MCFQYDGDIKGPITPSRLCVLGGSPEPVDLFSLGKPMPSPKHINLRCRIEEGGGRRRRAPPTLDRLSLFCLISVHRRLMSSHLAPPIQTGAPYPKILDPPLNLYVLNLFSEEKPKASIFSLLLRSVRIILR